LHRVDERVRVVGVGDARRQARLAVGRAVRPKVRLQRGAPGVEQLGWSAFLLSQVLTLLVGFAVLCAARRWPRAVTGLLGVVVVAALAGIWFGAELALADFNAGRICFVGGLALLTLGGAAFVLVAAAREQPGAAASWAGVMVLLFGYLFACWVFAFVIA